MSDKIKWIENLGTGKYNNYKISLDNQGEYMLDFYLVRDEMVMKGNSGPFLDISGGKEMALNIENRMENLI